MDKKIKFVIITLIVVGLIIGFYFLYNHITLSSVSIQKMKYCVADSDCVPVKCICRCSGCGGFSYEDIVNKKYVDAWYYQQGCKPPQICPAKCCLPRTIACENNVCVVKEMVRE